MNSPFNEARYKALLEGLEISEVGNSKIEINKDLRIDSDFWTKELNRNPIHRYDKIGNLIKKAQYGISINMNEEGDGTPIYRMNEIHNMLCDLDIKKHAILTREEIKTFKLNDKDVLFNRTNSYEWVGRTGLFRKHSSSECVFASYLVRFIPDKTKLLPEYLTIFLNSKYGVEEIKRRSRQSINQTNVNPEEVKEIWIPLLSSTFQLNLEKIMDIGFSGLISAREKYQQAEQMLLEELGFDNYSINDEPVNIKSFTGSFGTSGRLDAEYYQKKYEEIVQRLKSYKNGFDTFETMCQMNDSNFIPDDSTVYNYIELSNIGKFGEIIGCTTSRGIDLPTRARRLVKINDVIISSIEGSLESCAIVEGKHNNSLCSTGFYVINSHFLNSVTLLLLFKSIPLQFLLKKGCSGTILTAINKTELNNILIPKISSHTQEELANFVEESFLLREKSDMLLEAAKRAVEIAIEESEESAFKYLEQFQPLLST